MKEIKFTPENCKRHFNRSYRYIFTTRDSIKGEPGELFIITDPEGKKLIYVLVSVIDYFTKDWFLANLYRLEGFNTRIEFTAELERIYPNTEHLYIHRLHWLGYYLGGDNMT